MKRHWIEYNAAPVYGPMTYWVHRQLEPGQWQRSGSFDPPLQPPVPGRGYPHFHVEYGDFTFHFASLAELRACIDVLGHKVLPTTLRLTTDRAGAEGGSRFHPGPNTHWLSTLPAQVLTWRYRERAVAYMRRTLAAFEEEVRQPRTR